MAAAAILNLSKVGCWAMITLVWPISICTPNLTIMSSLTTEIWQIIQIHDGARHHLEFFPKVRYFAMGTLVWAISGRTLKLIQIYSSVTEIWPNIQIQHGGCRRREFCQKWDDQDMANDPDSRWRPPPLNFNIYQKWDIGPQWPSYSQYLSAHQMWRKCLYL